MYFSNHQIVVAGDTQMMSTKLPLEVAIISEMITEIISLRIGITQLYKESSELWVFHLAKDMAIGVNEQSQDHTFGILFGLTFINEFVDNIYVKPTNNGLPDADRGFRLIDEVKLITDRIISKLADRKTLRWTIRPRPTWKSWVRRIYPWSKSS
jgi:hypothetical protein